SFWPAHQDLVTDLHFLQEPAEGLAQSPTWDTQALGPCWEPKALETLGALPLAEDAKNMLTPVGAGLGKGTLYASNSGNSAEARGQDPEDPTLEGCRRWDPPLQCLWYQVLKVEEGFGVQEIWHPVLQLLAGAQEKCPAQETVWQIDPRWKTQASGPRAPGSGGHWPPPWPLLQSGLAEHLTPSGNAHGSETHIVNISGNKEQNYSEK
ncbi:hypothetical protein E2I00_009504, partial [Balaenoptera physalus]